MSNIVIAMATDENYLNQISIAINSLILNSSENTHLEIHILVSRDFSLVARNKIRELETNRAAIYFEECSDSLLHDVSLYGHITIATFYRLFLSRIIDKARCLYLDADIVVLKDLSELYNMNMDGYLVAGVRDYMAQLDNPYFYGREEELGIVSMHNYVNAGVMLFNLDEIRATKTDIALWHNISKNYKCMDQDIINSCCTGRINYLPMKYNVFSDYIHDADLLYGHDYSDEEIREGISNPVIIHYAGIKSKPWKCVSFKPNDIWFDYAKRTLSSEEYSKVYESAAAFEKSTSYGHIIEHIKDAKQLFIFGDSDLCHRMIDRIDAEGHGIAKLIVDNDLNKVGNIYRDTKIVSVDDAMKAGHSDAYWVITSLMGYSDIRTQLIERNIESTRILQYIDRITNEHI